MSVDSVVQFLVHNNSVIIEVLIGLILVSIIFLAFRTFMTPDTKSGGAISGDLEEALKKILEKANSTVGTASANASAAAAAPSVDGAPTAGTPTPEQSVLLAEIDGLKKNLEERKTEIDKLKSGAGATAASGGAGGLSTEEKAKLDGQIKELQSKLQEYEIISEDIADLSHYKEQNAKLQKELEGLKGGAGATATAPTPTAAPAAPASAATEPPPDTAPPASAPAKPEPAIVGAASATQASAVPTPDEKTPIPATASPEATVPQNPADTAAVDDEIMAEFEKAANAKEGDGTAAGPDLGSMDMDKMLAEATGIESAPISDAPANALEGSLDENKLLQEASLLTDVKPEDKNLMNDFENFVKKPS